MKRNVIKALAIVLLVVALVFVATSPVFASGFDQNFPVNDSSGASGTISTVIGTIIFICQLVGMGVAIIMLLVIAIKYIAASPNDKAEIKKHLVVYIVGAVLLFAASGLLTLIKTWALSLSNEAANGNDIIS